VSDAWSTDVVASDNEGGADGGANANGGGAPVPPGGVVPAGSLPDIVPSPQLAHMPDGQMARLDLIREERNESAAAGSHGGGHEATSSAAGPTDGSRQRLGE
jgi:hypothetical protein